nr:hypothetical protein [Tanacetum cinerariifolium]
MELQERSKVYVGRRGSISEEVSTPFCRPRTFVKYHDLSFGDKALLMEEDCDNPQFQVGLDVLIVKEVEVVKLKIVVL